MIKVSTFVGKVGLCVLLGVCNRAFAQECGIALVPGAFGPGTSSYFLKAEEYFQEARMFFEAKGCRVQMVQFPVDATIEERGRYLRDQVERFVRDKNHGKPVALLAHSQGGVDGRFALRHLKLQGVKALVTIGTPHRGTPVADWVVHHRESESPLYWLLKNVAGYDLKLLSFAGEMTSSFLERHSEHFAEVPGVGYASAKADCRSGCHWSLRSLKWWLGMTDGDGLIPAASQSFGEDLGTFNLDHISEVDTEAAKRAERVRFFEAVWTYLGR